MRNKVIVFEDSSKVAFGGGQAISLAVISILAQRNYQIVVYDHKDHEQFKQKCANKVSKFETYSSRKSILKSMLSHEASERRVLPLMISLLSIIFTIPGVLIKEYRNEYDIIYSTTKKMFFVGLCLNLAIKNSKHIFHWHSFMSDSFGKRLLVFLMKITSTQIIVPSNFMKNELSGMGLKITIVENYAEQINDLNFKPLYLRSIDIAFVGGDLIWKGAKTYQKVVDKLSTEYKDKDIISVATGKTCPSYFSYPIKSMCVHNLSDFLCDVKIVLFPSESPEAFCISAVEASNAGCCVLYNPIGALPEVLGDDNLAIPILDNDIGNYCQEILKVVFGVSDPQLNRSKFNTDNYCYQNFESKVGYVFNF